MGLDYRYVEDGNDLATMIEAFRGVKDVDHPVVLHVHTLKGKGFRPAEEEKMRYHWRSPFDPKTGADLQPAPKETYSGAIIDELEASGSPL